MPQKTVPTAQLARVHTATPPASASSASIKPTKKGWGEGGSKTDRRWGKEDQKRLKVAVEALVAERGGEVTVQRLVAERKHAGDLKGAWLEIAAAVPGRSVYACYRRAAATLDNRAKGGGASGRWSKEAVTQLMSMVKTHGKKWVEISNNVNRLPTACRDKWRSEESKKSGKQMASGSWSAAEEQRLQVTFLFHSSYD